MSFDPNDMEVRRQQYRESMLGVNRPQQASKQAVKMVDGLIQQAQWAQNPGSPHHQAVLKDRRKALLRKIARMELVEEEAELIDLVVERARGYLSQPNVDTEDQLRKAFRTLDHHREHQEDKRG